MRRYFFLTTIAFSQLLLQNISVYAQAKKLAGTNIEFTLPNEKWALTVSDKSARSAVYAYQRESMPGDDSKPSISFIVEELPEKKRVSQYTSEKMRLANITEVHYYDMNERKKFGLVNGILSKGYAGGDTVYFGSAVNGLKAVMILCSAKGKSFAKYDREFLSLLASLKYSFAPDKADNTTGVSKSKTGSTENGSPNLCSYFPVVNGMKLTYKRNNMTGQHTITETYTSVKDKTLKSGKAIKGFKITSSEANRNNTVIYYYCDSGSVKMYAEMPEYNTQITGYVEDYSVLPSDYNKPDYKKTPIWETEKYGSGKYLSFTELKAGGVDDEWTDIQVINSNPVIITSEIEETGLTITAGGKTYTSVIHLKRTVSVKFLGEIQELNTQDIYYAKGIGKIKVIEKGQDILMGSYTTTQELISHNLPLK
jgi:hypothetical protein